MKLKLNDLVVVITGKDKGKEGRIIKIVRDKNRVVVEKVNIRTRHIKKTASKAGEKIQYEGSIDASNVMVICPETGKATRVGYKIAKDGKKIRISKKSGESLDKEVKTKK